MMAAQSRTAPTGRSLARVLEALYERYNDRSYVSPDPLEYIYGFERVEDREIAALVASSLAFGNVRQIGGSVRRALAPLGDSPAAFVLEASGRELERAYRGFKHRWIRGEDLSRLLGGVGGVLRERGCLGRLFRESLAPGEDDVLPALERFVSEIRARTRPFEACLLPTPVAGSACKRLNLFLRWMVRSDAVDPGGWSDVSPSLLIVPLDVHMFRICRGLALTKRRHPGGAAAREVTAAFRRLSPDDPVKYDFALTRLGIRRNGESADFVRILGLEDVLGASKTPDRRRRGSTGGDRRRADQGGEPCRISR